MSMELGRCPKCNGEMIQGFIIDNTNYGVRVSNWCQGAPERSVWIGVRAPEEERVPIGTFRCSACGFLESYARPEFAPE